MLWMQPGADRVSDGILAASNLESPALRSVFVGAARSRETHVGDLPTGGGGRLGRLPKNPMGLQ